MLFTTFNVHSLFFDIDLVCNFKNLVSLLYKCELLNTYQVGQNVKIGINLRGREWTNPEGETKYFNSIQGWRIDVLENNSSTEIPPIPPPTSFEPAEGDANEVDDDLPF